VHSMIPLGSCTMKLNAATEMEVGPLEVVHHDAESMDIVQTCFRFVTLPRLFSGKAPVLTGCPARLSQ